MAPDHESSSLLELMTGRNGLRSLALAGGVALHAINVYVVTTVMPSIVKDIGGLEVYAWSTTLFVIASILGSALSSRLIGRLGPRKAYLSALVVFCLGTVVCAIAPAMTVLLAGRTLQGLAGGLLLALSYALIRLVYESRLWSRALAFVSAMWGVATLSGPAIGGMFAQSGHWRLAFWALLPVAALLAVIVSSLVPAQDARGPTKVTVAWGRLGLLAGSVLAFSVGSLFDDNATRIACVALGVVMGGLIAWLDGRSAVRLLPSGAYSVRTVLGACYATMALLMLGVTTEIFAPYFLQVIHDRSPLEAGYLTAVMAGGWTVAALLFSGRTGPSAVRLVGLGPIVMTAALLALAVLLPQPTWVDSAAGFGVLCIALGGVGFGVGLCWPHLVTRVFRSAQPEEANLASSAVTTVQLYAMAIGAALAGWVANAAGLTTPGGVEGAKHAAIAVFALFAVFPALGILTARAAMRPR
ncbi:MFS transporter [Pigmentiphaga litoralis]|uniref:MFS transporter n=1 Tax=Pigmentiphaga litoralis TaxID=516702 RepID=UPI0016747EDD|nr:MFS transporter [Pigmentiphaga litoralis]GGX10002.1 MFS transporter [Pigmentiphaga litoralis]